MKELDEILEDMKEDVDIKDIIKSHGRWTKIENSSDSHQTIGEAMGICWRLLNDYGEGTRGCKTRGCCLDSWVTVNDIRVGSGRYGKTNRINNTITKG